MQNAGKWVASLGALYEVCEWLQVQQDGTTVVIGFRLIGPDVGHRLYPSEEEAVAAMEQLASEPRWPD